MQTDAECSSFFSSSFLLTNSSVCSMHCFFYFICFQLLCYSFFFLHFTQSDCAVAGSSGHTVIVEETLCHTSSRWKQGKPPEKQLQTQIHHRLTHKTHSLAGELRSCCQSICDVQAKIFERFLSVFLCSYTASPSTAKVCFQ